MGKAATPRALSDTEAQAVARMLRVSPQKLNLVAALIRGKRPALSNRKVILILKRTASARSFDKELGWGILDAGGAVRQAIR